MSRALPRWARRIQARLLQRPGITEHPVCPRCGRTMPLPEWDLREGCCRDCSTERFMAWDDSEDTGPFLPEDQ